MRTLKKALPALLVAWTAAFAAAAELSPPRFFAGWEGGQIEEAFDPQNKRVDREVINRASVWTLQQARLADRARVNFGIGGAYFFVFPRNLGANPYAHTKRSAFGLTEANGEFDLWKPAVAGDGLRLKAGVFSYKYNEDAKNLGEYMFRTWTYPVIIYTGGLDLVNSAGAQLSGLAALAKTGSLSNDLILNIQSDHVPVGALSLTDLATWRLGMLTLGGGLMWDNFYHPDKNALTPKPKAGAVGDPLDGNKFYTVRHYIVKPNGDTGAVISKMSHSEFNELKTANALGPREPEILDTGYYTFTGGKAMLRGSLDLSGLLGGLPHADRSFGLYFEAILLGFKNYPTFYEKMSDRMVYMAGINLPTFGLLEMFSVEAEYCSYPYRQSTNDPNVVGNAVPNVLEPFYPVYKPIRDDDWKWSVFAQRRLGENFSVYAQVANDHLRNSFIFGAPASEGFLTQKNHWYWVCKLGYAI
jgi:hypothetical protein